MTGAHTGERLALKEGYGAFGGGRQEDGRFAIGRAGRRLRVGVD